MITSRDNSLWLQFWRDKRSDFHQKTVNQLLIKFWLSLDPLPNRRVFVPLCGKSLDMLWLARQGHQVIGVELSPVAVKAFFSENHLKATRRRVGKFVLWQHQNIRILCGDFFALNKSDLGTIDLVYDRAALTALPEDIRGSYVEHLRRLVPVNASVFLLTTEDAEQSAAPDSGFCVDAEINTLFSTDFDIDLTHAESGFEINHNHPELAPERTACKVYRLSARTVDPTG
ncbi:MAG: thiopurine S-methyltransferase [Methylococcales bacterium]|nr:thiopurine S-methyltransferase [Methylococcales bacterium]